VPHQTPEAAKPRYATAKDDTSLDISEGVLDLIRKTRGREPEHFIAIEVMADDLATLGKLFTSLAKLKKHNAVRPAGLRVDVNGNDVPPAQSAENMKARLAALEANGQQGA